MGTLDEGLTASRWDDEYRRGRYVGEPPLPFVSRISTVLKACPDLYGADGLYIGCGNGRNYLPLIDSGLRLYGLDVSEEVLNGLTRKRTRQPRGLPSTGEPLKSDPKQTSLTIESRSRR
jgi:methyltransferase family protein